MVTRTRGAAIVLALLVAIVVLPARVGAQSSTGGDDAAHRVAIDLGVSSLRRETATGSAQGPTWSAAVVVPEISVRVRLLAPPTGRSGVVVDLDAVARTVVGESRSLGDWVARAGQPYVGVRAGGRWGDLTIRGGGGLTIPTGVWSRPDEAAPVLEHAHVAMAGWDAAQLLVRDIAFVVRGDAAFESRWFFLGAEGALVTLAVLEPRPTDAPAAVATQLAVWIGARVGLVDTGVRASLAVALVDGGTFDAALVPFVRLRCGWLAVEARTRVGAGLEQVQALQVLVSAAVP